jgi:hypothetical protein
MGIPGAIRRRGRVAKSAIGRVRRLQTGAIWRTQSRSGLGRVAGVNGSTYLLHFEKERKGLREMRPGEFEFRRLGGDVSDRAGENAPGILPNKLEHPINPGRD